MLVASYIYIGQFAPKDTTQLWVEPKGGGEVSLHVFSDGGWKIVGGGDGKSAYELAVEKGYSGTLDEWLDSLQGKSFTYDDLTSAQKAELAQDAVAAANRAAQAAETIEAAINGLDPSQSAEDAVVALAARQGVLEGDIAALGPKCDQMGNVLEIESQSTTLTDFSGYTSKKGILYYAQTEGYFYNASGTYGAHIEIPIQEGAITITTGSVITRIHFLKTPLPNSNLSAADLKSLYLADPSTGVPTTIEANSSLTITDIPNGATSIYVWSETSGGESRLPASVSFGRVESNTLNAIKSDINAIEQSVGKCNDDIGVLNEAIHLEVTEDSVNDFSQETVYNGNFAFDGFLVDASTYGTNVQIAIPQGASSLNIVANASNAGKYGFLKKHITTNLNANDMSSWVAGSDMQGVAITAGSTINDIQIPADAKFLFLRLANKNEASLIPISVTFVTRENDIANITAELPKKSDKADFFSSVALFEKMAVIGDSYSSGAIIGLPVVTGDHYGISWLQIMARRNGCTAVNYSTGGETPEGWLSRATRGLADMLADEPKNLYWIKLGINGSYPNGLGTIADCNLDYTLNADSFYGNYGRIIGNILAHAPKAKVICLSNSAMSSADRNTAISEIASFYGVAYINEKDDSFFTSDFYRDTMSGAHPIGITYAGMATAYERLFCKHVIANPNYWNTYVGNN